MVFLKKVMDFERYPWGFPLENLRKTLRKRKRIQVRESRKMGLSDIDLKLRLSQLARIEGRNCLASAFRDLSRSVPRDLSGNCPDSCLRAAQVASWELPDSRSPTPTESQRAPKPLASTESWGHARANPRAPQNQREPTDDWCRCISAGWVDSVGVRGWRSLILWGAGVARAPLFTLASKTSPQLSGEIRESSPRRSQAACRTASRQLPGEVAGSSPESSAPPAMPEGPPQGGPQGLPGGPKGPQHSRENCEN